jgi:Trypsin
VRRYLTATAIAALVSLTLVVPVGAITNGSPDLGRHPYVGLVGFYSGTTPSSDPDNWLWRCSGSLISPRVVLTAGHCTAPDAATGETPVRAQIWFGEKIVPAEGGYPYVGGYLGIPHTYGEYNGASPGHGLVGFSYGDVGVVVLDQPVPTWVVPASSYATLPTAGLVDTLPTGTSLDQVGYGVSYKLHMSGPPYDRWTGPRDRQYAPSVLISGHEKTADDQLKHSSNPGGGKGGTCFGDSGGPMLLGGTPTVLAVNSYGTNANCAGVDYATRIDIKARLDWIKTFPS